MNIRKENCNVLFFSTKFQFIRICNELIDYIVGKYKLYIVTTAIVVIASLIITMPLLDSVMAVLLEYMFFMYSGWMTYYVPISQYVLVVVAGIASYAVIAFLQMHKVKKIPMEDALKTVE